MLCFFILKLIIAEPRIASLSPETTSILLDLNLKNNIKCISSPNIYKLENVQMLGSYHNPNLENILACKPSHVITTYSGTPIKVFNKLNKLKIKTINYTPKDLDDIVRFTKTLASLFNVPVSEKIKSFDKLCLSKTHKTALIIVGLNPIYIAGANTLISKAVTCAGFNNIEKGKYKKINFEKILKQKPEYIIVSNEINFNTKELSLIEQISTIVKIDPNILSQATLNIVEGINYLKDISSKI